MRGCRIGVRAGTGGSMETNVRTPLQIFSLPQRLVIPLFQRPYVWDETDQWEPLWGDVRRLAEFRLANPGAVASHFLGAVVVQAQDAQLGALAVSNVIDGQQRLTTLQLLMDATAAVLEEAGDDIRAGQLQSLTHNQATFVSPGDSTLKIHHTNRDRAAFAEVMAAEPPVNHDALRHSGSLITRAHGFFARSVEQWLGDPEDGSFPTRAEALVGSLSNGLQLVAINLTASENSQEIFETLNARGTPLTAADLIKNFVFQRLDLEGADTHKAYAEDWPFDTKFWEVEVSIGRYRVSRSSLFLNQWLQSRTGEEISPQSTFTRFKSYVEHSAGSPMAELLPTIKEQARRYEEWTVHAEDPYRQLNRVELAFYRMAANELQLLKPLLIWLHEPGRDLSPATIDGVVDCAESWVMRRMMMRLSNADLGRIVADLVRSNSDAAPEDLVRRVENHLRSLSVTSTYWPGDDAVRESLRAEAAYRRFKRGRLRAFLEAAEDSFRRETNQPQVPRIGYPIEHVLPQRWQDKWRVSGLEAEIERAAHVHRLGNLTLLTGSLNSKVSNGSWSTKRAALKKHDTLLLNSRMLAQVSDREWDEAAIAARAEVLIDALLRTWSVPAGHVGEVLDTKSREAEGVDVKDLVRDGLIEPGARLIARKGRWVDRDAIVLESGLIEVDGKVFETPSGAGKQVRGGATNGWSFWSLEDGRRLGDVRATYRGDRAVREATTFDWDPLHRILEALPDGHWTSYGSLAEAVGTAAQPLGQHITRCLHCANAHRVLSSSGEIASRFAWSDPNDVRDPKAMLEGEGLRFEGARADSERFLDADALTGLVSDELVN